MYSSGSVKATPRPTTRLVRTDGNPLMSRPGNRGRIHPRCPGCRSTSISPKELGESPGWVATQLGHTNAEMVYRRYHRFIPNLRGRDGALAAKGLAHEGL